MSSDYEQEFLRDLNRSRDSDNPSQYFRYVMPQNASFMPRKERQEQMKVFKPTILNPIP